jgi:hypothetical protein
VVRWRNLWCRDARHLPTILPRSSTWQQNEGRRNAAPQCVFDYASIFEVLATDSAVFFLSFAANSCLTLAAMASVSTLSVLAALRSTVAGFDREAASRMLWLYHQP